MTVTLKLSAETVLRMREKATRSGLTLEAFLEQLVEESVGDAAGVTEERTPEEWVAEWRFWTASHRRLPIAADDDRASIYAGRGE